MKSKEFGIIIEKLVKEKNMSYMDAVIHYCEENDIDLQHINKLISNPLKEKISVEAQKLNFLPKTGALPL